MKRSKKNLKFTTKQQPYATKLSPSKLCRWLLLAVFTKLAVLGLLFTDVLPKLIIEQTELALIKTTQQNTLNESDKNQAAPNLGNLNGNLNGKLAAKNDNMTKGIGVSQALAQSAEAPAAPPSTADTLSREAMQQRQDDLARKEQELKAIEKNIDTKLEDLKVLETKLQGMLKEADSLKDAKYRHLVDVYSNMKAKQAAEVLQTLDEKIAVKLLSGMKGRQAGEILTFVLPAKAARLSEALTKIQMSFE